MNAKFIILLLVFTTTTFSAYSQEELHNHLRYSRWNNGDDKWIEINDNSIEITAINGSFTCSFKGKLLFENPNLAYSVENNKPITAEDKKKLTNVIKVNFYDNELNIKGGKEYCGAGATMEGRYLREGLHLTSFKCTDRNSATEKIICRNKELAQIDLTLEKVYKKAKNIPQVRDEQVKWLKEKDTCVCNEDANDKKVECIFKKYYDRIQVIQNEILKYNNFTKTCNNQNFNIDYFIFNIKNERREASFEILEDPALTKYLKKLLSNDQYKYFTASMVSLNLENIKNDDNIIFIMGSAPGLYGIMESALAIDKRGNIWLSIIEIDNSQKIDASFIIFSNNKNRDMIPRVINNWIQNFKLKHFKEKNVNDDLIQIKYIYKSI